jgi:hypothetical protein
VVAARGGRLVSLGLRLRGLWWALLPVRLGGRSRKSCDFAAAAQELRLREWWLRLCRKSCDVAATTQELVGRACHRSRQTPNPALYLTRPRLLCLAAVRMWVQAVAVAAGQVSLTVRPSEPYVPPELRLRGRRWVPQELRFHGAWWCGCGPGGTMGRCGCRGRRRGQPHQSCGFTVGGGAVAGPPGPPVSPELRLRDSRTRVAASRVVVEVVPQELRLRGSGSRVGRSCVPSVSQNAEPGAAPDPAASFVSCSFPNVRVGGCGRGRAGELDRSAVRAIRSARVATSRQAVGSARVAVSRRVVVWLRSRRHDGTMRVPRSPKGPAPPELRFHGRWWRGCGAAGPARVATSRQPHKSCGFAAAAGVGQQELRLRGSNSRVSRPCASSVSQDAEPGAAPDPAASFVSCSGPNVRVGGCGRGRAGELDRSAVQAMRSARIATSRQAVGSARVAVSRRVVVWLRSRRHDGTMRVPRSPRGSAPPELRFHGRWWAWLRVLLSRRFRKSCDFAAAAQELRLRQWWLRLCGKSCGFAAAAQELIGRACHRSCKTPNPALHLTRPRLLFLAAVRMSVSAVAVAAGQVSLIVRPSEPCVSQELRLRGRR